MPVLHLYRRIWSVHYVEVSPHCCNHRCTVEKTVLERVFLWNAVSLLLVVKDFTSQLLWFVWIFQTITCVLNFHFYSCQWVQKSHLWRIELILLFILKYIIIHLQICNVLYITLLNQILTFCYILITFSPVRWEFFNKELFLIIQIKTFSQESSFKILGSL